MILKRVGAVTFLLGSGNRKERGAVVGQLFTTQMSFLLAGK